MKRIIILLFCLHAYIQEFHAAFQATATNRINLQLLKNTSDILQGDQVFYDPFWGLAVVECEVAEFIYDHSAKEIKELISAQLNKETITSSDQQQKRTAIINYLRSKKNTGTENLVQILFHRAGQHFAITTAPNNPVSQFTPKIIGQILRIMYEYQTDYAKLKTEMAGYLKSLQLKKASGTPFSSKDFNPFINALCDSLQECFTGDVNALYAPHTTHAIMLGYMLKKAHTKQDLQSYFTGFLGKPLHNFSKAEFTVPEMTECVRHEPSVTNITEFADYVCSLIYLNNYCSTLPNVTGGLSATYDDAYFADCVETALRNLCNIATYNAATKKLGTTHIDIMSAALQQFYSKNINANPAEIGNRSVHQDWAQLVENVDGAAYNQLKIKGIKEHAIKCPDDYAGFIPVTEAESGLPEEKISINNQEFITYKKQIGQDIYLLIPKTSDLVAFELMPTLGNVVVIFNNLFHLNLYATVADTFAPTFTQDAFARLCSLLAWNLKEKNKTHLEEFVEGKANSIVLNLDYNGNNFSLHLSKKIHGYVQAPKTSIRTATLPVSDDLYNHHPEQVATLTALYKNISPFSGSAMAQLVPYAGIKNNDASLELIGKLMHIQPHVVATENILEKLILQLSVVEDPHFQQEIILHYINHCLTDQFGSSAVVTMLNIVELQHRTCLNWKILSKLQDYSEKKDALHLQKNMPVIWAIIKDELTKGTDSLDAFTCLRIVSNCLKKNSITKHNIPELLVLLQKDVTVHKKKNVLKVFEILNECIEQNLIEPANMSAIMEIIRIEFEINAEFANATALELLTQCLKAGIIPEQHMPEVLGALQEGLQPDESFLAQNKAKTALKFLIDKDIAQNNITEALKTMQLGLDTYQVQKYLDTLMDKKLIKPEHMPELLVLLQTIFTVNVDYSWYVFKILNQCVDQDLIVPQNVSTIIKMIEKESFTHPGRFMQLLQNCLDKKLVTQEHIPKLLNILQQTFIADENFRYWSLEIINQCVDQNLIIPENMPNVMEIVQQGLASENSVTKFYSLKLIINCLEKGIVVPEIAIMIYNLLLQNPDYQHSEEINKIIDLMRDKVFEGKVRFNLPSKWSLTSTEEEIEKNRKRMAEFHGSHPAAASSTAVQPIGQPYPQTIQTPQPQSLSMFARMKIAARNALKPRPK